MEDKFTKPNYYVSGRKFEPKDVINYPYLDKIDFGIKIPKKKSASTYLFCQRVDICFTDKDDKILYLYENVKTEKRFFKFKAYNVYYLPLNTCSELKIGDKLNVKDMISD